MITLEAIPKSPLWSASGRTRLAKRGPCRRRPSWRAAQARASARLRMDFAVKVSGLGTAMRFVTSCMSCALWTQKPRHDLLCVRCFCRRKHEGCAVRQCGTDTSVYASCAHGTKRNSSMSSARQVALPPTPRPCVQSGCRPHIAPRTALEYQRKWGCRRSTCPQRFGERRDNSNRRALSDSTPSNPPKSLQHPLNLYHRNTSAWAATSSRCSIENFAPRV